MPSDDDVTGMLITKQRWVEANKRLIDEIGGEEWLRRLLAVLEGDTPSDRGAYGYTCDTY